MPLLASFVAQTVKNTPAMQETWLQSLGQEDPLEEDMATHSSIFAWRIPWTEEPDGLQFIASQRIGHDWVTKHTHGPQLEYTLCEIQDLVLFTTVLLFPVCGM